MHTRPPARLLSRTVIREGRIFRIEVDTVTLPTGHTLEMEVIRHPGSVVLLPVPAPGHVVLIRQYRYTLDRYIWELPAGSLKPGEDPEAAAVRECEEEIGLVPARVERLKAFHPTPGFCDELMIFYRCSDLTVPAADSTATKDEDEDIEPRTFTLDEARRLVAANEIVDLKTVAGLPCQTPTAARRGRGRGRGSWPSPHRGSPAAARAAAPHRSCSPGEW